VLELVTFVTGWEAGGAEKRNRQRLAAHARRLRRQDTRGVGSGPRSRAPRTLRPAHDGRLSLGQLVSRHRRSCAANQPIRLFQNVGICRLFSRKKAEHHERHAK
jgi:hypothetical protein